MCLRCPSGTYKKNGEGSLLACTACTARSSDHDGDPVTPCTPCHPGQHTGAGVTGACADHACLAGTHDHDSDAATSCQACPQGTHAANGTHGDCAPADLLALGVLPAVGGFLLVICLVGYLYRRRKMAHPGASEEQLRKLRTYVTEEIDKLGLLNFKGAAHKIDSLETPRSHIHMCDSGSENGGGSGSRRASRSSLLGEGEFGVVRLGMLAPAGTAPAEGTKVAIKLLRSQDVDAVEQEKFLFEASGL